MRRKRWIVFALAPALIALALLYLAPGWLLDLELARRRLSSGAEWRQVDVQGQHWRYLYRTGRGTPILLLHGLQGEANNWIDVLPRLPEDAPLLVPDLPGFGQSPSPTDRNFTVQAQVARLHAWLVAIDQTGPNIVIGHSMGGALAGFFSAQHADQVAAVVFIDSAGVPFAPNAFSRQLEAGDNPYLLTDRASFARLLDQVMKHPPWLPQPVLDAYADRALPHATDWDLAMRQLVQADQRDILLDVFPDIRAPALVIWCREDTVLDVSSVDAFRSGLPLAKIELLDDCGHTPIVEAPARTAAALRPFLQSHR